LNSKVNICANLFHVHINSNNHIGNIVGGINQRRGTIIDTEVRDDEFQLTAEVSLNDMFGYSSALRGATQGKGEFSMEYKVGLMRIDEEFRY
jgi:elongation factor G